MREYHFRLVKPKLKGLNSGIFNKDNYSIEDGLGNFSEIINKLNELSSKDPLLKKNNSGKDGPFRRSLEINKKENEKLKVLSSLNNWFIFEKY